MWDAGAGADRMPGGRQTGYRPGTSVKGSLEILYEDQDIFAVNKPPGMPTHPGRGHYLDSLANLVAGLSKKERPLSGEDRRTAGQ